MRNMPRYTLIYDTKPADSPWIGTAREFFDDHAAATRRHEETGGLLRIYNPAVDRRYLAQRSATVGG